MSSIPRQSSACPQPIEIGLAEARQRNVGRRETGNAAGAMIHEFAQSGLVLPRQPLDRLPPIALAPVPERQPQTSFAHLTGDVQPSPKARGGAA